MTSALQEWTDRLVRSANLRAGDLLLDIGGGTGTLARSAAIATGATAIVADRVIPTECPESDDPVRYLGVSATMLPFADQLFDAVLMSHVLHHIRVPRAALREACRVLKPGRRLLIRTASHNNLRSLPHARFIPALLRINLESVPDVQELECLLAELGASVQDQQTVLTPREESLEDYADGAAFQAWREWALAPVGQADPREMVRNWIMERFTEAPPIEETLLVACRNDRT